MKIALSYLKWLIIGIVSIILIVILAACIILVSTGSLPPSRHSIIAAYKNNADAFDQIRYYLDNCDISAYRKEDAELPNIIIRREFTANEVGYSVYVNADQNYKLKVEDETVRHASDTLFQKTNIQYIVQKNNTKNRNVYFGFKGNRGIVFSRSGIEPDDSSVNSIYKYRRINDKWFYWVGTWED
jgi:hypothetical protein